MLAVESNQGDQLYLAGSDIALGYTMVHIFKIANKKWESIACENLSQGFSALTMVPGTEDLLIIGGID